MKTRRSAGGRSELGWDRPALLRQQLRAMILAAAGRPLSVMFPLIAQLSEFERARAVLNFELDRARARNQPLPERLSAGIMLEVPALLWQLPSLLRRIDFLSVGTNDFNSFSLLPTAAIRVLLIATTFWPPPC